MARLSREMQTLARQAGGSYKTVHDRLKIAERLASHLLSLNIQICSVQHLKAKHIESYIVTLLIIEDRV
ncbi:Phage DNA binding protein [Brenneria goodwinii]|uniref:Phage DNA binding protein n=1 Tax=Brenneria goodwinii TaxID=1109412 RepID=A0A0G4JV66_9GAMM|nr:Phage DNA binding protein [Brenneria goodwinii]